MGGSGRGCYTYHSLSEALPEPYCPSMDANKCPSCSILLTAVLPRTPSFSSCSYLQVLDLLHGLMLPSGNDAATALADYYGQYCRPVAEEDWQPYE